MRSTGLSELAPGYLKFSISALSKWRAKGCDKYLKVFTERVNSAGGIVHSSNVFLFTLGHIPQHPCAIPSSSTELELHCLSAVSRQGPQGTRCCWDTLISPSLVLWVTQISSLC